MNIDKTRDPGAQVLQWMLDGNSEADICQAIREHFPKQKAESLITSVLRHLERDRPAGLIAGFCVEATRELYRRAIEIGDLATGLRALKLLADLAKRRTAKPSRADDEDDAGSIALLDVG